MRRQIGRLLCKLFGHKWSKWRLEYSWIRNDDLLYRQCKRRGCMQSQKKDYAND
ncbi:MAG: DUF1660 family phage protein [Acetobacter sp.]|nr:DUF1660 family phage protein [Acetobacter sp.]